MRSSVKHALLMTSSLTTIAALAACGADKPAQEPSSMNTTTTTVATTPMPESKPPMADTRPIDTGMPPRTSSEPPATPAKTAESALTDAEIVAATSAANTGEIEMAQLAAKNAISADVKNYAAMMIAQHRDMETKGRALAAKAKLTPLDSDLANGLKAEVTTMVGTLKTQKGQDFDAAYIDAQVKSHREVLAMFDNKLLPSAMNGELKTLLSTARAHVAAHLAKAEEIQQKLASDATRTPAKPELKR